MSKEIADKILEETIGRLESIAEQTITKEDKNATAVIQANKLLLDVVKFLHKMPEESEEDEVVVVEEETPKVDDNWDEGLFLQTG